MKVENEDFEPETVQEQEDEINENERQGRDYNALINSAKLIESEMYGELDKQDPFYTCYKSLEDLIEKFQDEKLENKN